MNKTLKPSSSDGFELTIKQNALVSDAIRLMEQTPFKTVFVINEEQRLIGIITNGDLRRFMLSGGKIQDSVDRVMNVNFKAVHTDAYPEEVIKLFDLDYSIVPRIDDKGRFIDYLTPDSSKRFDQPGLFYVRARAPARISFAGGGTDLTYFFSRLNGLVLNAAISRYSVTTLFARNTPEIDIYLNDLNEHHHFKSFDEMNQEQNKSLVSATVALIKPEFGFEIHVNSEFPVGSGLGGSSAVTTSVLTAFNELRTVRWSRHEVANLAFQAERICFKVSGGWQDQYASAFGGFNLIDFNPNANNVHSLRLPSEVVDELEESLVLFDTGISHSSGDLHVLQKEEMMSSEGDTTLSSLTEFCLKMNQFLSRGELIRFGEGIHEAWVLKKQTSKKITSPKIDSIYTAALENGAIGGKLLGAGAGGHILFFVPPAAKKKVIDALSPFGCKAYTVRFDLRGAHSWRARSTK